MENEEWRIEKVGSRRKIGAQGAGRKAQGEREKNVLLVAGYWVLDKNVKTR